MLDVLEFSHILTRDHNMSVSEYYSLVPWMLDVKLAQIERDIEEEAERIRRRNSANQWS